ncbi:hypothetical protein HDU97_001821 [Phlyctochytrium planicorne]|nr:hypothetical protein HDU97_001821 [Phlyctochytrium planicorne]
MSTSRSGGAHSPTKKVDNTLLPQQLLTPPSSRSPTPESKSNNSNSMSSGNLKNLLGEFLTNSEQHQPYHIPQTQPPQEDSHHLYVKGAPVGTSNDTLLNPPTPTMTPPMLRRSVTTNSTNSNPSSPSRQTNHGGHAGFPEEVGHKRGWHPPSNLHWSIGHKDKQKEPAHNVQAAATMPAMMHIASSNAALGASALPHHHHDVVKTTIGLDTAHFLAKMQNKMQVPPSPVVPAAAPVVSTVEESESGESSVTTTPKLSASKLSGMTTPPSAPTSTPPSPPSLRVTSTSVLSSSFTDVLAFAASAATSLASFPSCSAADVPPLPPAANSTTTATTTTTTTPSMFVTNHDDDENRNRRRVSVASAYSTCSSDAFSVLEGKHDDDHYGGGETTDGGHQDTLRIQPTLPKQLSPRGPSPTALSPNTQARRASAFPLDRRHPPPSHSYSMMDVPSHSLNSPISPNPGATRQLYHSATDLEDFHSRNSRDRGYTSAVSSSSSAARARRSTSERWGFSTASSERIMHKVFKGVIPEDEPLYDDHACAYLRDKGILAQGRIYLTRNYFLFTSNILGFQTTIVTRIEEVVGVNRAKTAFVIPNAVEVVMKGNVDFYTSFMNREQAFTSMRHLIQTYRTVHNLPQLASFLDVASDTEAIAAAAAMAAAASAERSGNRERSISTSSVSSSSGPRRVIGRVPSCPLDLSSSEGARLMDGDAPAQFRSLPMLDGKRSADSLLTQRRVRQDDGGVGSGGGRRRRKGASEVDDGTTSSSEREQERILTLDSTEIEREVRSRTPLHAQNREDDPSTKSRKRRSWGPPTPLQLDAVQKSLTGEIPSGSLSDVAMMSPLTPSGVVNQAAHPYHGYHLHHSHLLPSTSGSSSSPPTIKRSGSRKNLVADMMSHPSSPVRTHSGPASLSSTLLRGKPQLLAPPDDSESRQQQPLSSSLLNLAWLEGNVMEALNDPARFVEEVWAAFTKGSGVAASGMSDLSSSDAVGSSSSTTTTTATAITQSPTPMSPLTPGGGNGTSNKRLLASTASPIALQSPPRRRRSSSTSQNLLLQIPGQYLHHGGSALNPSSSIRSKLLPRPNGAGGRWVGMMVVVGAMALVLMMAVGSTIVLWRVRGLVNALEEVAVEVGKGSVGFGSVAGERLEEEYGMLARKFFL